MANKGEVKTGTLGELIGFSPQMQRVYTAIRKVSPHPLAVLIGGENGTGEESAARSIHLLSSRRNEPFVALDCNALAPTLLDPELFGYERGAFVGASQGKWGLFSLAGEGSLFLDEVANLPLSLQGKLLRALETGNYTPIGAASSLPLRARILAGTHRDLPALVKKGLFREDLYFRLSMTQIQLPALREHKGDIPLLADSFIEKYTAAGTPVEFTSAAMSCLLAHDWPGNVRELENVVRKAVAAATGPVLGVEDLNLVLGGKLVWHSSPKSDVYNLPVDEMERNALVWALRETEGDRNAAAGRLGIGAGTLNRRLKYYGLAAQKH